MPYTRPNVSQTLESASQFFKVPAEVIISAKENDMGIDILKQAQYSRAKVDEWLYDEDELTELEDDEIVVEIIRQQLYQTYQRKPISCRATNDNEGRNITGTLFIEQTLYVPRESVRKVLQQKF